MFESDRPPWGVRFVHGQAALPAPVGVGQTLVGRHFLGVVLVHVLCRKRKADASVAVPSFHLVFNYDYHSLVLSDSILLRKCFRLHILFSREDFKSNLRICIDWSWYLASLTEFYRVSRASLTCRWQVNHSPSSLSSLSYSAAAASVVEGVAADVGVGMGDRASSAAASRRQRPASTTSPSSLRQSSSSLAASQSSLLLSSSSLRRPTLPYVHIPHRIEATIQLTCCRRGRSCRAATTASSAPTLRRRRRRPSSR